MAESPTLDEFQQEVTAFLDANAELKEAETAEKKFVWGEGSDDVALFEEIDREKEREPAPTPRRGGPSATTPASAGSPGRPSSAAAS